MPLPCPNRGALRRAAPHRAEFLASVERKGELLRSGLREALAGNPHVKVRAGPQGVQAMLTGRRGITPVIRRWCV